MAEREDPRALAGLRAVRAEALARDRVVERGPGDKPGRRPARAMVVPALAEAQAEARAAGAAVVRAVEPAQRERPEPAARGVARR